MTKQTPGQMDLLNAFNNPYSTSNPGVGRNRFNIVGSSRRLKKKHQRQRRKRHQQAQQRFELRKCIEAEIRHHDHCVKLEGREFDGVDTVFQEALHRVQKEGGRRKDYTWFIEPDTMNDVKMLFRDRLHTSAFDSVTEQHEMYGVPFIQHQVIPKGWLLLCRKDYVIDNNQGKIAKKPIRPHPMALVEEVNAGFREQVSLSLGGEINFRVVNL